MTVTEEQAEQRPQVTPAGLPEARTENPVPEPAAPPAAPPEAPGTPATAPSTDEPTDTVAEPSIGPATDSAPEPAEQNTPRRSRDGIGRGVVQWLVPVALFAIVGSAASFAVAQPRRTDVPGLRTQPDGRYLFAPLRLPALPRQPPASSGQWNATQSHLADIRTLLLRPPVGAVAVPGSLKDGWTTDNAFDRLHTDTLSVQTQLDYDGCRHVAAREWRTPDGATTAIYLLQFDDGSTANDFLDADPVNGYTATAALAEHDERLGTLGTLVSVASKTSAHGTRVARLAEFASGDTVAVVLFTAPSRVGPAPFDQIVTLQAEMLG